MRTRAYRRAQQDRMISKAKRSRTASVYSVFGNFMGDTMSRKTGYYKRLSNDMAQCSCWMCTSHKRRPTRELSITELKSGASARQQLEDVAYG